MREGKVLPQPFNCPPVVYSWPGTETEATNFVLWVTKELREQALSSSAVGYIQTGGPEMKIWRGYCWFPTSFSPVLQDVKKHACGWGGSAWKSYNPTSRPVGRDGWNWSTGSCHYRDTPDMVMSLERHTGGRIMDKADWFLITDKNKQFLGSVSLRWNEHGCANVELAHVRRELLFMLQGDRNHCRPAGAEELGWRVAGPPWVPSRWLHSLAGSQLLMPPPAAARPPLKAPSLLQSKVQTWTLWICVALGLFTVPGWGPCCCLSGIVSLWEVQLCFNTVLWKPRGELWVGSGSASVTASCDGLLGWRIPSRHQLLVSH